MKRLLAILIALTMLISLCACTTVVESPKDNEKEKTSSASKKSKDTDEESDNESDTSLDTEEASNGELSEDTSKNSETQESEEAETEASESVSFESGKISESSYTNETIGLSFTLPDGWRFFTDDEIAELNSSVADKTNLDLNASVYDMYAIDSSGNNVIVTVTRSDIYTNQNLDTYLTLAESSILSPLEELGLQINDAGSTTVVLDGEEITGYYIDSSTQGVSLYQLMGLYVKNGYLVSIAGTTLFTDNSAELFEYFEFI